MPNDLIRYDLLVQDALCGVVKKVLGDAARHGLPGDHHFYITFRTHAPGVRLSNRMRELYPEEMTIILQHQFEDLKVTDYAFEVGLSFKNIPEILLVPFDALTGFFDPSVQFSAKFEPQGEADEAGGSPLAASPAPRPLGLPAPAALTPLAPVPASIPAALSHVGSGPALASVPKSGKTGEGKTGVSRIGEGKSGEGKSGEGKASSERSPQDRKTPERVSPAERKTGPVAVADAGAQETKVVSIDAFRKKP